MSDAEQNTDIQVVVFRLHQEEFGIDINQVVEIIPIPNITPIPNPKDIIIGVINLRGNIIPVMDLAKQFSLRPLTSPDKSARMVVLELDQRTVAIPVDEVPQILKLSDKQIQATPEVLRERRHVQFLKGIIKQGERLILMLDLSKLMHDSDTLDVKESQEGKEHG